MACVISIQRIKVIVKTRITRRNKIKYSNVNDKNKNNIQNKQYRQIMIATMNKKIKEYLFKIKSIFQLLVIWTTKEYNKLKEQAQLHDRLRTGQV